jgi:RNA methyltransferase, TrmH family
MKSNEITSKENEKVKHLKKLGMKKYRDQFDEFLIENATILLDALRGGFKPTSLFVTQEFIDHDTERWAEIEKLTELDEYFLIDQKLNRGFSELDTPAGIGAVYEKLKNQGTEKLKNRAVYLNSISDPGNLGTILRSALAFNLETIVLDATCADLYNPKTIQAARDAIFKLKIVSDNPDRETLKQIKKQMPIVATDLDGNDDRKGVISDKFCLVLGNETRGIDQDVRDLADEFIKINMSDKIDSLNVAVAAGILFHEMY